MICSGVMGEPVQAWPTVLARRVRRAWRAGGCLLGLLIAGATAQAATVRATILPAITMTPAAASQPPATVLAQVPAIQLPGSAGMPPADPVANPQALPSPQLDTHAGPASPALPTARSGAPRLNPAQQQELIRLRRLAEPRSGFGSTQAAANAAWTLGLIELHGGLAPASPAQALVWFERAARYGRQPLAYAGLAWCAIDGCGGRPDPSAAAQALAQLRPHHRGRALYLQWLLDTRTQPMNVRINGGPEGVNSLLLPFHELLESAAAAGDTQARIELGLEAVANGNLKDARSHLEAAAPRSRAAAANLKLLELQVTKAAQGAASAPSEADDLYERARRAHRGIGGPPNYAEALRLYQAAASKGSAAARRMLGFITSRLQPDGTVNLAWMAQLAWLDSSSTLPRLDTRSLSTMMYRDPTPLFDLLPEPWQRALTSVPSS